MDASEADRLARLEREMAILRAEFARLREHVGASAPERHDAPPPRPPSQLPEPKVPGTGAPPRELKPIALGAKEPRSAPSFEQLVGRYGTIAVATITILVGVGIFLNWAIQNGHLGPGARVVLGYLGAIALAAGGLRLRTRGTRGFGNVLLAIALGVVHLVCWSAGPVLHVLPSWVALAIGFLASAVLAEFALRNDDEALCAIGFGGAAIAPFITSSDSGNVTALAAYGVVVVALSAAALGDRPWRVALRVTIASFALYVLSVAAPAHPSWPAIANRLGILFPIAVLLAVTPFAHARHRRALIRLAGVGIVAGALLRASHGPDLWFLALTVGASILAIAALDITRPGALEREAGGALLDDLTIKRIDALILPIGLFVAAIAATPGLRSTQSAGIAVLWTVLAIFMTHRARAEPEADNYATTASLTALWIVPAALFDHGFARALGMVAVGIALMLIALRMGRRPFAAGGIVAFVVASLWAVLLLNDRVRFQYPPFGTWATVVTVVAILGWVVALGIMRHSEFLPTLDESTRSKLKVVLVSGASVTAFFWGGVELDGAWNATASIALLIVYYAATGTLMIWLGRRRRIRPLRLIGLGLALLAAGKALVETFQLSNVAVRIAVFFVVSAFLIAVGYWYRRGPDEETTAAT